MLINKQVRLIADRVVERFVRGLRKDGERTTYSSIPSLEELQEQIDTELASVELGKPFFNAVHQDDVTSASKFNVNVDALVDDLYLMTDAIIAQIYGLTRHFSASEYEFRKVGGRLKQLKFDIDGLLLTSRKTNGYMYFVGDTFHDRSLVDDSQTTLVVDTKGGYVELPSTSVSKVDVQHYLDVKSPQNFVAHGENISIETRGTRFSGCMDDSEDTYYLITVRRKMPDAVVISFSVQLHRDNTTPVCVSAVTMSGDGTYSSSLAYRNTYTSEWTNICPKMLVTGRTKFSIPFYKLANQSSGGDPGVLGLRFTITKGIPDRVVDGEYEFDFLIKSLDFYNTGNTQQGYLYSKTLPYEDWEGSPFTVNQLSLSVDEEIPPGTSIDYYVAIDPYAEGTLRDSHNDPVKSDAADIDNYLASSAYPDASGVLYSVLRDNSITGWETWEPNWQPISPIERDAALYTASGMLQPKRLDLNNYTVTDEATTHWATERLPQVNGINFYKIHTFETEPHSMELWQGRRAWLYNAQSFRQEVTVEAHEKFVIEDWERGAEDYFIFMGPSELPAVGHLRTYGHVVPGSVSNITWYQGDIDSQSENFYVYDESSSLLADVHVEYDSALGTATIVKNPAAVWDVPDAHIKFRYRYYELATANVHETNAYVPDDVASYIVLDDAEKLNRVVVANTSESYTSIVYDANSLLKSGRVILPAGWNNIKIYVSPGVKWDPTTSVTFPDGIEYYAHYPALDIVSKNTLLYNTHRDDHMRAAIFPSGGGHYLVVNDPCTPSGTVQPESELFVSGIGYYHETLGHPTSSGHIFSSVDTVNDFYDLSYREIGTTVTNVLFKVEMRGDGELSPTLCGYGVRAGDELKV